MSENNGATTHPIVDLEIPENLNDLLDRVAKLTTPCSVDISGGLIPLMTDRERDIFYLGLQAMWSIQDDRTKRSKA